MKHLVVRVLTWLKLIHGGPIYIIEEHDEFPWPTVQCICIRCNAGVDVMTDEDFEEPKALGMAALLCGDPFKVRDWHCNMDGKSLWRWDGRKLWVERLR